MTTGSRVSRICRPLPDITAGTLKGAHWLGGHVIEMSADVAEDNQTHCVFVTLEEGKELLFQFCPGRPISIYVLPSA